VKEEFKYWLALTRISGMTWGRVSSLLNHLGGVEEIFRASTGALLECRDITLPIARRIKRFNDWDEVKREMKYLEKNAIFLIHILDSDYPEPLRNIYDPPLLLYYRGNVKLLKNKCMAIVGSRHPSDYGREATEKITRELCESGFTIVSGFAQGIDSEAHLTAIKVKGWTIGVFGCGIDVVYPAGNKWLYDLMVGSQLVITEFPPGTRPFKGNFPRRNRIISGLSSGVVIVEATRHSGSLITARCALEQGRDVFAVPGMITSPKSEGCHYLIKEGAKLVEGVADIIEEEKKIINPSPRIESLNLSDQERMVVDCLRSGKKHIDFIIQDVQMPSACVTGILTSLELSNIIKQLPGKYFELVVN